MTVRVGDVYRYRKGTQDEFRVYAISTNGEHAGLQNQTTGRVSAVRIDRLESKIYEFVHHDQPIFGDQET